MNTKYIFKHKSLHYISYYTAYNIQRWFTSAKLINLLSIKQVARLPTVLCILDDLIKHNSRLSLRCTVRMLGKLSLSLIKIASDKGRQWWRLNNKKVRQKMCCCDDFQPLVLLQKRQTTSKRRQNDVKTTSNDVKQRSNDVTTFASNGKRDRQCYTARVYFVSDLTRYN